MQSIRRNKELSFDHVKPVRWVSPVEFERIRAGLTGRDRLIADCFFFAGARPGEILGMRGSEGLRWRDVFLYTGSKPFMWLYAGKTMRERQAIMFDPLPARLRAFEVLSSPREHDFVFPSKQGGGAWSDVEYSNWTRRVFKPACERAGLPHVTPFMLRHGYANLTYWAGSGLKGLVKAIDITPEQATVMYSKVIDSASKSLPISPDHAITQAQNAFRIERETTQGES